MTNEERKKAIDIFIKRAKCRATSIDNIIEGIDIKCGETACEECPLYYDDDELHEAERIAIEALKQEPCEDAISRKTIKAIPLENFKEMDKEVRNYFATTFYPSLSGVLMILHKHVELIDSPTREHGEWIRVDDTKCKCSKCEITHFIAQYPHGKVDFCPNCGADMRKEQNNV